MKCHVCGSTSQPEIAFGLTKQELQVIHSKSVGIEGRNKRRETSKTGYELFAIELEKLTKVAVKDDNFGYSKDIVKIAEDIYDHIVSAHAFNTATDPSGIKKTPICMLRLPTLRRAHFVDAIDLLKRQGRIVYKMGPAGFTGWIPYKESNK